MASRVPREVFRIVLDPAFPQYWPRPASLPTIFFSSTSSSAPTARPSAVPADAGSNNTRWRTQRRVYDPMEHVASKLLRRLVIFPGMHDVLVRASGSAYSEMRADEYVNLLADAAFLEHDAEDEEMRGAAFAPDNRCASRPLVSAGVGCGGDGGDGQGQGVLVRDGGDGIFHIMVVHPPDDAPVVLALLIPGTTPLAPRGLAVVEEVDKATMGTMLGEMRAGAHALHPPAICRQRGWGTFVLVLLRRRAR
ncbi:hypothetical protein DFH09DRAFT_1328520 [Mycena vulgaris]|nr:hypothetical protein DFH09DRAFT_1328520 [Mycena vulgaris]